VSGLELSRRLEVFGRGGIVNCDVTVGKFLALFIAIKGGFMNEEISCFEVFEVVVS
jgi:hypothetical protein